MKVIAKKDNGNLIIEFTPDEWGKMKDRDENPYLITFGAELRAYRELNSLSLRALAQTTKVSFATLSRIENGGEPSLSNYRRIQKVINP